MSTTRHQPVTCRHADSANFTTTYHHLTTQSWATTYRLTNDAKL